MKHEHAVAIIKECMGQAGMKPQEMKAVSSLGLDLLHRVALASYQLGRNETKDKTISKLQSWRAMRPLDIFGQKSNTITVYGPEEDHAFDFNIEEINGTTLHDMLKAMFDVH
jgi:hypothetical protein